MDAEVVWKNFLEEFRVRKLFVRVFTTNGFQLKGTVVAFDDEVLILAQSDGKQSMVYKHAVSTVVPDVPIQIL